MHYLSITVLLSKERKYVTKKDCRRHLRFYSCSIDESFMENCENENSFDLFVHYMYICTYVINKFISKMYISFKSVEN